jgi:hypothetical protein
VRRSSASSYYAAALAALDKSGKLFPISQAIHEELSMRTVISALAAISIALTASSVLAQTPAPAAPAASAKPSVETTTIGDLITNAKTKAVLATDYAGLLSYDGLDSIKGMTLRDISKFPQAQLDDALLAKIQKDFDAIPAS